MEANPSTFEQGRVSDYRACGINRLSIGVQSFKPEALKALGRVHSSREAIDAVAIAQAAGFEEINLDLMFALPGQTLDEALADVRLAASLGTTHLSCYELTLEPNTLFARFPPVLPADDTRADMQAAIIETLAEQGFERYEVSAYARSTGLPRESGRSQCSSTTQRSSLSQHTSPAHYSRRSHRSVHNLNYWLFGDYLGIGAGAHGKISSAAEGNIVRRWKVKHPARYLEASTSVQRIGGESSIPLQDSALEFMMNALRLIDGFPIPLFEKHTGTSLLPWQTTIEQAISRGLLVRTGMHLKTTDTGLNWLNEVLELFLPGSNDTTTRRYPVIPLHSVS